MYLTVLARDTTPTTHAMSAMCGISRHRPPSTRNRAQALVTTRLLLTAQRFHVPVHSLLDTLGSEYETGAQPDTNDRRHSFADDAPCILKTDATVKTWRYDVHAG